VSAPLAIEHQAALEQLGRALAAVLASAAERSASDSAAPSRPLAAGDQPTMHEAAPTLAGTRDGFEEDDHREQVTTADA